MKKLFLILAFLGCVNLQAELFFTPEMISSRLKGYSEEEVKLIEKDLQVIRSVCLDDKRNVPTKFYLATAGGPGARKTTILEKFVSTHPEYQEGVYLDPDARGLKFMAHTYQARSLNALVISHADSYSEVIKNAYNKWRDGSNYIVLTLLEEALAAGRSIIHGTTSTGAHVPDFFSKLKQDNYKIVLLLCLCPDNVRYEAIRYRNETVGFYQCSPEDAVAKGSLSSERMGAYFSHADQLFFYWTDRLFGSERLAGVWQNGKLEIHDAEAMQNFVEKYEADRASVAATGKSIPSFEKLLSGSQE